MLAIGYDAYQGGGQRLNGAIAEVGVWKTALSSAQVSQLYRSGRGSCNHYPDAANMVAGYHFDEGSGTTAHDFTGNGHDGTLFGAAGWTIGAELDGAIVPSSKSR